MTNDQLDAFLRRFETESAPSPTAESTSGEMVNTNYTTESK